MIPRIYIADNARLLDDFFWDAADDDTLCDPALCEAHYLRMRERYLPHAADVGHPLDVMAAASRVAKAMRGAWCITSLGDGHKLFCETADDLRILLGVL